MNHKGLLVSGLLALPALLLVLWWIACTVNRSLLAKPGLEKPVFVLIGLNGICLIAVICHLVAQRRQQSPDTAAAVVSLIGNVIGVLSNVYGFGLAASAAVGKLL